jgi:hypothetical protein
LGTDKKYKREFAMPNTGDHVIGSPYKSHDAAGVQKKIEEFMKNVLQLKEAR